LQHHSTVIAVVFLT